MRVPISYYYSADNLPVFSGSIPVDVALVDCDDVGNAREIVFSHYCSRYRV